MESLDKLKQKRSIERSSVTKLITKIEALLSETIENTKIEELQELDEIIRERENTLKMLNSQIETQLEDVKEFEKDISASDKYNEQIMSAKFRIKIRLNKCKVNENVSVKNTTDTNSLNTSLSEINLSSPVMKLPKLNIPKFAGDSGKWLEFFNSFQAAIDQNKTLTKIEKFVYLKSLLIGQAYNVVEGFQLTEQNYDSCLGLLKERFGKTEKIIKSHMNNLLDIEPVKNCSNLNALRRLHDACEINIRSLSNLGVTSGSYGHLLNPILMKLLPHDLILEYHRKRDPKEESDVMGLLTFLKNEIECRELTFAVSKPETKLIPTNGKDKHFDKYKSKFKYTNNKFLSKVNSSSAAELLAPVKEENCIFCKNNTHNSEKCNMSVNEKRNLLKTQGRCYLCLAMGHRLSDCPQKISCAFCYKKHNVTLCYKNEKIEASKLRDVENSTCNHIGSGRGKVFLQTATVELKSRSNNKLVRCLFDCASQRSFIQKQLSRHLGLKVVGREEIMIHTFGARVPTKQNCARVEVKMRNIFDNQELLIEVLETEEISNAELDYPPENIKELLKDKGIILTDVYHESLDNNNVSLLIGADNYWKIVEGKIERLNSTLVTMESKMGWILMGKLFDDIDERDNVTHAIAVTSLLTNTSKIENLWKLDTIGIRDPVETKSRKETEDAALVHFRQTIAVNDEGRYEIKLPWVENKERLKTNLDVAERRCKSTTNKLIRKGGFLDYEAVFNEWLHEDVIEDVPFEELEISCHYLPHRGVYKENSTTKIRPVFDASCRGVESPSLNDFLEKGPNLLEQIPPILIRFRRDKIGVTSDIRKAFLQISVSKIDRNYLRFLWWKDFEKQIFRTYRHKRVVFGLNCSPFLLAAVLNYHIEINSSQFPETCDILKNSFYVDNLVTSVPDERRLQNFIQESTYLLKLGCFDLRGWEHTALEQENRSEKPVPVLGLLWDKDEDVLFCNIKDIDLQLSGITRRGMLATVHKIFDTIGVLCPTTLVPKLILQKSWDLKIGWDEVLPDEYRNEFKSWMKDIPLLSDVRISRCLNVFDSKELSLHTFCDGSKHAYSAVVFLRTVHNGDVKIHLIQAKARVTPLRKITIPRIELLACCIGARLASSVLQALNLENISCFYWSDSSTALTWIKKEDHWGVFVGNRVQEIRKLTHKDCWKHIPSAFNAADLASRGCSIKTLVRSKWWLGPDWLKGNVGDWPSTEMKLNEEEIQSERRKHILQAINCSVPDERWYLRYFSKYGRILRMVAWILRFINNCKGSSSKLKGELTVPEIETAEKKICRLVQAEMFERDVKLKGLCTFIDPDGLIRLKTKITRLDDEKYFRCPIVLPSDHDLTRRLIIGCHLQLSHAGVQFVLARIRQKFWILRGRKTIQRVLSRCVRCKKYNSKGVETVPAPLPEDRIREALVFEVIGVDVAGPLYLKKEKKAWILLFTCAVYRAVHLELIESLSTNGFFLGLRRFIARRGRPRIIYSDNGTNFIGADNLLRSIDWNQIERNLSTLRIQWKFNPPTGSWWGGWWERLIQMVKKLLRNVLGKSCLSYEEMSTILCDVESTINSRPLTYLSEDPDDFTPLTPLMFIQDVHNVGVPDLDHLDSVNLTKRYRFIQTLKEHFRRRFRDEYLALLIQKLPKRRTGMIKKNDLVYVGSDSKKRIDWPMGRVTEVYPGKDGEIRVVKVKTATGEITRPVKRLFPLELDNDSYFSDLTKNRKDSPTECDNIEIYKTRHGRKTVKPSKYF